MPRPSNCQARRVNDQMVCHQCGLIWDLDDPEPPVCCHKAAPQVRPGEQSDAPRERVIRALRRAADALEEGATIRRGGLHIDVAANGDWTINSDAVITLGD